MLTYNKILLDRRSGYKWIIGAVLSLLMLACTFWEAPEVYWEGDPVWSPDGEMMAFECYYGKPDWEGFYPDTGYEICVVGLEGDRRDYIRLTQNDQFDHSPFWSPDSKRLVFASRGFSGETFREKIMMIDRDGTNLVELTDGQGSPAWSPTGQYVAYEDTGGKLALINIETGDSNTVSSAGSRGDDFDPVWSPDGQSIAFTSNRDGHSEIYLVKIEGGGESRLTDSAHHSEDPVWSPDGNYLAFLALKNFQPEQPGSGYWAVDLMKADGSNRIELEARIGDIVWTSDNQHLLLAPSFSDRVFMLDVTNKTKTQLSPIRRIGGLSLSPDGQRVTVIRYGVDSDETTSRIWLVNLNGSGEFKLTQH